MHTIKTTIVYASACIADTFCEVTKWHIQCVCVFKWERETKICYRVRCCISTTAKCVNYNGCDGYDSEFQLFTVSITDEKNIYSDFFFDLDFFVLPLVSCRHKPLSTVNPFSICRWRVYEYRGHAQNACSHWLNIKLNQTSGNEVTAAAATEHYPITYGLFIFVHIPMKKKWKFINNCMLL